MELDTIGVGTKRKATIPRRVRKKSSTVWQYYRRVGEDNVCTVPNCGATYTTNITSTLQRHLDSHTNFELSQYSLRRQCFDLPVEDRISNWMIRSLLPFRCVDNQEFKDLFLEVVPSRKAIKHQIEQKFNLRKEK